MAEQHDIKERTFEFACRIVMLCRGLEAAAGVSQLLARQLLRSGTAIGASVEEGHGSHGKQDFIDKMAAAAKEARETRYWLRLLAATDAVPAARLDGVTDECGQLVAILSAIVKNSRMSGGE